jgi:hypothetical protein
MVGGYAGQLGLHETKYSSQEKGVSISERVIWRFLLKLQLVFAKKLS